MFSEEEAKEIKEKIIAQIESTFPAEKIAAARQQIESMNSEELEKFLERNNIVQEDMQQESNCVFCSIISESIKSVKIGEDENAVAVLDINPISKGQTLIVLKNHGDDLDKASGLVKKISAILQERLKPKKIKMSESKLFGHGSITLLPVYSDESLDSERRKATIEELEMVREELEKKPVQEEKKPEIEEIKEKLWLPKRIP